MTDTDFGKEDYFGTIDSLLVRISNDTVALLNYLSLSQSTRDLYAEMMTYRQLGIYYLNNNEYPAAIQYHKQYLDAAKKEDNPLNVIEALNTLAYDYSKVYALDESSKYYFKALSLLENLPDIDSKRVQSEKAKTLNGLGNISLHIHQVDEALFCFRKSLEIDIHNENIPGQAKNLADIGSSFEHKLEYDSAHHYFDRSLQLFTQLNLASGKYTCYERIGNLYIIQGDYNSASTYIESACNELQHTPDRLNRISSYLSLGNLYLKKGDFQNAEALLRKGLMVSEELGLPHYLEQASMLLSDLFRQQGKSVESYEAFAQRVSYAQAFRSERNISQIMTHRLAYEKKLKEKEMALLTAQLEAINSNKSKTIRAVLLFIVVITGCFVFFIVRYQWRKHKVKTSLRQEKMKSNFYVNMFHELKTPITIITGLIERISKSIDNSDLSANSTDLEILSRQSQNILMLTGKMSSAANVQKYGQTDSEVNGDIATYLFCLFDSFSELAEAKGIDFTFHDDIKEMIMDYRPETLRFIFGNLLRSIIEYCQKNDTISIRIGSDGNKKNCIVTVFDSANGDRKKELQQIFTSNHRKFNYNARKNGSFNNLVLIKQIVEEIGGSIELKTDSQKKTAYRVSFPIRNKQVESKQDNASVPHSVSQEKEMGKSFEQKKENNHKNIPATQNSNSENGHEAAYLSTKENPLILIADDNPDLIYYLASFLEGNYSLLTVYDGAKAVQKAIEIMPDLVISSVTIPQMNGYDMCKEIKQHDTTAHIPVILLSAFTSKEERVKGFRCGADAFLTKPVSEDEMVAVINQLLSVRKQMMSKYVLTTIDTARNRDLHRNNDETSVKFLKQVTDLIYKEIENTDNIIESISDKLCMSSSQLNRKIKATSGMTTSNYILKVRLNKAKRVLMRSQKPIGEIALSCGFNDFSYFSRSFKKEFGMTPTSFQRLPHSID